VKLAGHGYSLSYRRGYYAVPDPPPVSDPGGVLNAALQPDTPLATMLLLKAKVQLPDAGRAAVEVDSTIDPGNVQFSTDAAGRRHARLLMTLVALPDPAPGTKVDIPKQPLKPPQSSGMYVVDLDQEAFRKLFKDGMPAHQQLLLPAGRYRLRLGVLDLGNQRVGTLDMPVVIAAGAASTVGAGEARH
jgi:hypothetical protein